LGKDENSDGSYNLDSVLKELATEGDSVVKQLFETLNEKPKDIAVNNVFITRTEKLKEYAQVRINNQTITEKDKDKVKLAQLSQWILEKWSNSGVINLPQSIEKKSIDMVEYLNKLEPEKAQQIVDSLPPDVSDEKNTLKNSVWNFTIEKFDLDKNEDKFDKDGNPDIKTHLHHLAFAVYKILAELQSGSRYRSKYFDEVKDVLENEDHQQKYLKKLCQSLANGEFNGLNAKTLTNLIAHISNLELKPLRKYFNKPEFANSDQWDEQTLAQIVHNWLWNEWRVGEKDTKKVEKGEQDYQVIKAKWRKFHNVEPDKKIDKNLVKNVVDFWLKTEPAYTIPPYQDNNNRKPPKCQSLVLNVAELNACYPNWQQWLQNTEDTKEGQRYLADYKKTLTDVKSGKGATYFSDNFTGKLKKDSGKRTNEHLQARTLQFILDRTKKTDPFNLNEIYGLAKKIKQKSEGWQEYPTKLKEAIRNSQLPPELKSQAQNGIFDQHSFLHLICKYYKLRQRARDGRIFIHPKYKDNRYKGRGYEDSGRFETEGHLLIYCNHKPRQQRYLLGYDVAGVLQISPKKLKELAGSLEEKNIEQWLNESLNALPTRCKNAAKEQKDRRGNLKPDVSKIFGKLYYYRKEHNIDKEIELNKKQETAALNNSNVVDASTLYKECKAAKIAFTALMEKLGNHKAVNELQRNPVVALYFFSQLQNIVFKERQGNAKTCSICSADNALRMQVQPEFDNAKAQRLPAISVRIIDGAIKRIARIVGGRIADDKWQVIAQDLQNGHKVTVPIITESNAFEFEPSRHSLVNPKKVKKAEEKSQKIKNISETHFQEKNDRIKKASQGICPYIGDPIGEGSDKDHIIPRSSKWGTLNDETNFIWASDKGNRQIKVNKIFSLANLHTNYKAEIFGNKSDKQIEQWIEQTLEDDDSKKTDKFKFGVYRSFINLDPKEQKAFRHALFLVGTKLRDKVIKAIDNKNRTIVNGTQRYFASVIANNLYKKAKALGVERAISFDYFGIDNFNNDGVSVYDVRQQFEQVSDDINKFAKTDLAKQKDYSHLLDAQIAFMIAACEHRQSGSLKLNIPEYVKPSPLLVNQKTGEILTKQADTDDIEYLYTFSGSMLENIMVQPPETKADQDAMYKKLVAVSSNAKISNAVLQNTRLSHQKFSRLITKPIFKQNALGERFRPIVYYKDNWYIGYPQKLSNNEYDIEKYCVLLTKKTDCLKAKQIVKDNRYYKSHIKNSTIAIYTIKLVAGVKQLNIDSGQFFNTLDVSTLNEQQLAQAKQIEWIISNCRYYVQKTSVNNLTKVLINNENCKLPLIENWLRLDKKWRLYLKDCGLDYVAINEQSNDEVKTHFDKLCRDYFLNNKSKQPHTNVRGEFTMLAVASPSGTMYRINRGGKNVFQTVGIDTNIVSKNRSNFLVQNSKNIVPASKSPLKDLKAGISSEQEFTIDNEPIDALDIIFNDEFLQKLTEQQKANLSAYISKTSIAIANFPLSEFKKCLFTSNKELKEVNSIAVSKSNDDEDKIVVNKKKLKEVISATFRDGNIKEIKVAPEQSLINFDLPFKKDDIKKLWNQYQQNNTE